MKPLTKIADTSLPDGAMLELWERDGSYFLLRDGVQLASSFSHGNDDAAAELAAAPIKRANQPTVLIDGLGLGFQLSAVMATLNREKASFIVAEPCADLVAWNENQLDFLHPGLLSDPRVMIESMSALDVARKHEKMFHAVLIKSTQGRCQLTIAEASDYCATLKQGGLLILLLSKPDTKLNKVFQRGGFEVTTCAVPSSHKGKQTNYNTILIAKKGRFIPAAQRSSES
ncbi:MAG: hypothetical protein RR250_02145 [Akkermansia sp.]